MVWVKTRYCAHVHQKERLSYGWQTTAEAFYVKFNENESTNKSNHMTCRECSTSFRNKTICTKKKMASP